MRTRKRHRFAKVLIWVISIILINIIALVLLLQAPVIQTRLAQYLSRVLSGKTGFNITVNEVDIKWVDRFTVYGLNIVDEANHNLLSLESLDVNYKLASVLKEHIHLDKADLQGLNLHIHKEDNDTLNISILINRIKELSRGEKKKSTTTLSIDEINISHSNFDFYRDQAELAPGKFNPKNFKLVNIEGQLQSLVIVSDTFKVDIANLQAVETTTNRKIHNLRTKYLISPRVMRFDSLYAHFSESEINKKCKYFLSMRCFDGREPSPCRFAID